MDAAFTHDSAWATVAVGKRHNNPGNHRCVSKKNKVHNVSCAAGNWAHYPTLEDGIYGNVALYKRMYSGKGADYFMRVWVHTGNQTYRNAISACF